MKTAKATNKTKKRKEKDQWHLSTNCAIVNHEKRKREKSAGCGKARQNHLARDKKHIYSYKEVKGFTILDLNGRGAVEVIPPRVTCDETERPSWHLAAVTLSCGGHSLMEVSKVLGKDIKVISQVVQSDWAKQEITLQLAEKDVGALETTQLKAATMGAVMVLQELMYKASSDAVRLGAAKEVLNRTLGTPTTKVLHMQDGAGKLDVREQIEDLEKKLNMTNL